MGSTLVHGAVTLDFDELKPYSFESNAEWPATDDYDSEVREAVESVLLERFGSLDRVAVVLCDISFDPVHSSSIGFSRAARAATEAAFAV